MWKFLGIISFLASIVLLIYAVIKVIKKSEGPKKYFMYAGIAFVVFVVAAINDPTQPTSPTTTTTTGSSAAIKPQEKKQPTAEQQKLVKDFEASIYAKEKTIKSTMDSYQETMSQLGKTKSVFDAYDAAKRAEAASATLRQEFGTVQVPKDLPEEVQDLLRGAVSDISTAYYCKENAFEAAMKFLDDQKPSNTGKYKEEISLADNFTLSATAKIFQAKEKMGITATKEK